MVCLVKRRGAPAPVVEYISPVPAVISSPEPVVEHIAPAPGSDPSLACDGVYRFLASSVPSLACDGVFFTCASCDPSANVCGGVPFTRARSVSSANTSGGVYCAVSRLSVPSLLIPRTCLRLKTCTRAPGSRCQCPSKHVLRRSVRRPWARRARHRL